MVGNSLVRVKKIIVGSYLREGEGHAPLYVNFGQKRLDGPKYQEGSPRQLVFCVNSLEFFFHCVYLFKFGYNLFCSRKVVNS